MHWLTAWEIVFVWSPALHVTEYLVKCSWCNSRSAMLLNLFIFCLPGNLFGGVLWRGICSKDVGSGLSVKVHGFLWKNTLHTEANMHHRWVKKCILSSHNVFSVVSLVFWLPTGGYFITQIMTKIIVWYHFTSYPNLEKVLCQRL